MPELPDDLAAVVQTALAEDIGSGDISAELIPVMLNPPHRSLARRRSAVWYGLVRRSFPAAGCKCVHNTISIPFKILAFLISYERG